MHEGKGGRKHHKQVQNTRALSLTVGHFIKHTAGSEPRTHRGGGKAAIRALLKASAVGVQAWRRRGTVGVVDEERGHGRHGGVAVTG